MTRDVGTALTIKENGGWCWFQDERVIVAGGRLIVASVAAANRGGSERGDIDVSALDLATGTREHFKLAPVFEANDHAAPALLELPDGRILAAYSQHHKTHVMIWRVTEAPGDIRAWRPQRALNVGAPSTYSNLFMLRCEGNRIYNFHRGRGFNPNTMVSDDQGESFTYGGRLLNWPRPVGDPAFTGLDGGRPYLKYVSNGRDAVHFVTTEDHPWAYANGVYHGFVRRGAIHRSDGSVAGNLGAHGVSPKELTSLFQGNSSNVAWTIDLRLDAAGHPVALFSVQKDGAARRGTKDAYGQDHRYNYARFDGTLWHQYEIAHAGTSLGKVDHYTGLAALDPGNPATVVISTNADPLTGEPLISRADGARHFELFQGTTADGGRTWHWTPLTAHSTMDNIRPVIPVWPGNRRAVLWLRGTYTAWTDYDLDVMALIQGR